ncbi:MAG: hypothetical protein H7256_05180 [Bdellovibrio sp.]|nr:hypothetical protein [Bdellovibrio sp.]
MKVAYIGYDLSGVRTNSFFAGKNIQVTYFLRHSSVNPSYKPLNQTPILTDDLMISTEPSDRTVVENYYFDKIKNNYKFLESEIGSNAAVIESGAAEKAQANSSVVQSLQSIIDIQYDSKNKKVLIEIEKHGVEEFDFFLTEQHALLSLELEKKNIHLFSKKMKTPFVWTTFNYKVEYAKQIQFQMANSSFFIVIDSDREFTTDNWMHSQLQNDQLHVSSFQPYTQLMNPAFQKFASERIQDQLADKLKFIQIKSLEGVTLSTVDSGYKNASTLMKASTAIPNFSFWTDAQIEAYMQAHIIKKINKINLNRNLNAAPEVEL